MRTTRTSAKGFTLIELMIVVAIIGILAAIAIPNFLRFQAKAKQSEARTNLAGIYTAQTAYFSEIGVYGEQFATINWTLAGVASARYNYGSFGTTTRVGNASWNGSLVGGCGSAWAAGQNSFSACAQGEVDNDATRDGWRVNDIKALFNVTDDVNS